VTLKANLAILTVSDRCSAGTREDRGGSLIRSWAEDAGARIVAAEILPDERSILVERLEHWSRAGVDLILTTGGTGLSSRDVTPEATLDVIDRAVPGIAEWIRASTGAGNRFAYLSRGVAGIRGRTLIVNLPGSPRAVGEYLDHLGRILPHALEQLAAPPGSERGDQHPSS
jgi:molybdenum cofactor synthesis domain-containing protein